MEIINMTIAEFLDLAEMEEEDEDNISSVGNGDDVECGNSTGY